jgi:hypothetical protein
MIYSHLFLTILLFMLMGFTELKAEESWIYCGYPRSEPAYGIFPETQSVTLEFIMRNSSGDYLRNTFVLEEADFKKVKDIGSIYEIEIKDMVKYTITPGGRDYFGDDYISLRVDFLNQKKFIKYLNDKIKNIKGYESSFQPDLSGLSGSKLCYVKLKSDCPKFFSMCRESIAY